MAFRKLRIGENIKIVSVDTVTYTNVDVVKLEPLPIETKLNTTLADGYVRIFGKDNVQLAEIEDTKVDNTANAGKFCVGADGIIKLMVTKSKYSDVDAAKKELDGYIVYYDIQEVEIIEDMFVLDAYDKGDNSRLYPSKTLSLEDLTNLIKVYCRDLSLERGNEPYFTITPSVKVKEIK